MNLLGFSVMLLTLCGLMFFLGYTTHDTHISALLEPKVSEYSQCANLSLHRTAQCLQDYVATFYNYTRRENMPRTLEDIKQNGGACYDYSHLYANMGSSLGFYSTVAVMDTSNVSRHAIAILSDNTGYCTIDQIAPIYCGEVK